MAIFPVSSGSCTKQCETYDIGPALVCISDPCDPDFETIEIKCVDQLNPLEIEITQNYQERKSQCSSTAIDYRKSGVEVKVNISLGEGQYRSDIMQILYNATTEVDPLDDRYELIRVKDNSGECLKHFEIVVKPYEGETVSDESQWFILPWAIAMTESFTLTYGTDDQREASLTFYGKPHPDSGERFIIRQPVGYGS